MSLPQFPPQPRLPWYLSIFKCFHSAFLCADANLLKLVNRNLTVFHLHRLNFLLQQFQEISQSFSGTARQNTDRSPCGRVLEGSLDDANVFVRQEVTFVKDQETLLHVILIWQHIVEVVIQETWHHPRLLRKLCWVDDQQGQICHFHPVDNKNKKKRIPSKHMSALSIIAPT